MKKWADETVMYSAMMVVPVVTLVPNESCWDGGGDSSEGKERWGRGELCRECSNGFSWSGCIWLMMEWTVCVVSNMSRVFIGLLVYVEHISVFSVFMCSFCW